MKELRRILLVNWYLFESLQLDVVGNIALIGANGTGKSSLIDAVQVVMMGGNQHYIRLNASAGEKSHRTIRDYCLGVVRDLNKRDELTEDLQPRDSSVSWIVLVFVDTVTGEPTSIGLNLTAALTDADAVVECRFIAPGVSLTRDDLVRRMGEDEVALNWLEFRQALAQQCPTVYDYRDAAKYIRKLTEVLSYDGQHNFDPERFMKNFRNAVTFRQIDNVSDFFHRHLLPPNPLNVKNLQQSMKHYAEIRDKLRTAARNVEDLEEILDLYDQARQMQRLASQYTWMEAEVRTRMLEAELGPASNGRRSHVLEKRHLRQLQRQQAADRQNLEGRLTQLEISLQTSDAGARLALLKTRRDAASAEIGMLLQQLQQSATRLTPVLALLAQERLLSEPLVAALKQLAGFLPAAGTPVDEKWPAQPKHLQTLTAQIQPMLQAAVQGVAERGRELAGEQRLVNDELGRILGQMKRLEQNHSPVHETTLRLMDLLQEQGIDATPLCDLIDVTDENWRNTIEAIMRGNREALIVAPDRVEEALRLYRREGRQRNITGARIVNTRQTGNWLGRCQKNSLAALIATDNDHARAFVNRLLGNIERVDTEAQLTQDQRAATADGMFANNGTITRLKPETLMLGREARSRQQQLLQTEYVRLGQSSYQMGQDIAALEGLAQGPLGDLLRAMRDFPDVPSTHQRLKARRREVMDIEREEKSVDTRQIDSLRQDIQELVDQLEALTGQINKTQVEWQRETNLAAQSRARVKMLQAECALARAERNKLALQGGFEPEQAENRLAVLMTKHENADNPLQALRQEAAESARVRGQRAQKLRENARSNLQTYVMRQSGQMADIPDVDEADPHPGYAAWAEKTRDALKYSTMEDFQQKANDALDEAKQAFRSGFIFGLRENLEILEQSIEEINSHLRTRPFHNEYYSFTFNVSEQYRAIVRLVKDIPLDDEEKLDLLEPSNDDESPHAEAMKRIAQMLMREAEEGESSLESALADYRNYYNYDVVMKDANGKNPVSLSYRLKKGSGGENQAPFYVAIGSALAATYRIQRVPGSATEFISGLALAMFDEAFSKLDLDNSINALDFMRSMGMQVLLAAPNEKYALMAGQMDTVVQVYREGGAVRVEAEYPTERARQLLNDALPSSSRPQTPAHGAPVAQPRKPPRTDAWL